MFARFEQADTLSLGNVNNVLLVNKPGKGVWLATTTPYGFPTPCIWLAQTNHHKGFKIPEAVAQALHELEPRPTPAA
jgi:hypothetical protein